MTTTSVHVKMGSYNNSKMATMITAMMNNSATITPMTGPIALLLLPLSAVDCCGELTMYTVNIHYM